MYLQKVKGRKFFLRKIVFVGVSKVNDKNRRIWIREAQKRMDPDPQHCIDHREKKD